MISIILIIAVYDFMFASYDYGSFVSPLASVIFYPGFYLESIFNISGNLVLVSTFIAWFITGSFFGWLYGKISTRGGSA